MTQRLLPVTDFPSGASPFGLLDMVGNAGDWVGAEGPYEAIFSGGTYRFNPEECRVDRTLPSTRSILDLEVTARCVCDRL